MNILIFSYNSHMKLILILIVFVGYISNLACKETKYIVIGPIEVSRDKDNFYRNEIIKLVTRGIWEQKEFSLLITDSINIDPSKSIFILESKVNCKQSNECMVNIYLKNPKEKAIIKKISSKSNQKNLLNTYKLSLYKIFYGNDKHEVMETLGKKMDSTL